LKSALCGFEPGDDLSWKFQEIGNLQNRINALSWIIPLPTGWHWASSEVRVQAVGEVARAAWAALAGVAGAAVSHQAFDLAAYGTTWMR
jgi:hypothetical protein